MNILLKELQPLLQRHHQEQLLPLFSSIPPTHLQAFLKELHSLPSSLPIPHLHTPSLPDTLEPFTSPRSDVTSLHPLGLQAVKNNSVISMILAGGDGTRLGYLGPKGCFPISLIMKKSLFQLHCEKIVALQKLLGCSLPLAILTSESNYQTTVEYFKQHQYFGLKDVKFLKQSSLPLYTQDHLWCFKDPTSIATAPSGNGALVHALKAEWSFFEPYQYFMVINIDNALASPYDIPLISSCLHHKADIALRCFKHHPQRDVVGVLAQSHHHLHILDHTSIKDRSSFPYGNINTLCFAKSFIEKLFDHSLPIHWVSKESTIYHHHLDQSHKTPVLKGETFLSDSIALADHPLALDSSTAECFAPLKNLQGAHDVKSVEKALLHHDQEKFKMLTGLEKPSHPIELAMEFYYPTQELLKKCSSLKRYPQHAYLTEDML